MDTLDGTRLDETPYDCGTCGKPAVQCCHCQVYTTACCTDPPDYPFPNECWNCALDCKDPNDEYSNY